MLFPLLLLGCADVSAPSWRDQLSQAGPCWEVQLGDGLSEDDTEELHALFDCLNQNDNFTPLAGMVASLDAPSRAGVPLGVELARIVNTLPSLDVDVFGLAGFALDLLQQEPTLIEEVLQIVVEGIYGQSYLDVSDSPSLSSAALDNGIVRPALPLIPPAATLLIDAELTTSLSSTLTSEALDDTVCLLVGLNTSPDPTVAALSDAILPDLGQAISRSRSPGNDHWADASGDSLRDLLDALLLQTSADGQTVIEALRPNLKRILLDDGLRDRLLQVLADVEDGGHLDPLPLQLKYLSEVDINGDALSPREDSALLSLLRMLHTADNRLRCSVSVLGLDLLDVNIDNLSVAILRFLAQQSPDTIDGSLDLLGGALGWGLTQSILDTVVDSEVCPLLSDQLIADLESVNRLSDPEAADLLSVMLDLLDAFYRESESADRTEALVGVLSVTYARGAVPPVEEALRDLADSALVDDVTDMIPILLDPDQLPTDSCPTGASPLSMEDGWSLLADGIAEERSGELQPLVDLVLTHNATWTVMGNLGTLLSEDKARIQELADIMTRVIALDPELSLLKDNAMLLDEPALIDPALRIIESSRLATAIGQAELTQEGPLPFAARLIVGDTLQSALHTIDLLLEMLTEEEN